MSNATDDDERRRRCLEAGREMLEKYKAERAGKSQGAGPSQTDEASDEESFHNEKSIGHRESYAHEGISSRDITQSSVSMSEGEADGDLEGMAGRVVQLEELLQGKEAIVEALNAEFDHLRAEAPSPNSSQSQNSSIHSREVISLYHIKLQEFEKAINERDNLIEDLTWRLQLALSARDNFASQLNALNAMEIPCNDNAVDNKSLQEKIDSLEETLNDQRSTIQKLNGQLTQIQEHVRTLEMEKETRNAEVNDYKLQIDDLNEQIRLNAADRNQNIAETLEQQKQYETRVDKNKQDMQQILKKFTAETNANTARHQQELKDLSAKHETEVMNIQEKYEERLKQLKEENKSLADRLNKELPDLETRHAKELSIFQTQLAHYKKTVEVLKLELMNRSESQQTAQAELNEYKSKLNELKVQSEKSRHIQDLDHQKEKEMLGEQIKLHKIQLEEITSKYLAATAVLESKESIERSLEQALTNAATLKDENESLKFKLGDLSSRYSAAQSLIENSQCHERTLTNRIFDLEKSLSRLSGINVSTLSELNETTYQTMDEMAIQYQMAKQKLEEKAELEKLLVQRIEGLEEDVRKSKEELEEADFTKKSYEKQLKDMKNMCDKYKSELNSLKKDAEESSSLCSQSVNDLLRKTEEDQQEIKKLKASLEQKEQELTESTTKMFELSEKLKKSEEECDQLKNGLTAAWAQCAEVEERLNQTLGLSDSKLDMSVSSSSFCSALAKLKTDGTNNTANATHEQSIDASKIAYEQIDDLNSSTRISSLQSKLSSVLEENDRLLKELEDYEEMRTKLRHYTVLSENLATEKDRKTEENNTLKKKLESMNSVQESVNQLRSEKDALRKEVEALICVHDEQISAIKAETASEMRKVQSFMLGVKEGTTELNDLKNELEMRHAKEMEELRTYFEQKCLLMEKQYSEEIFSQQSKKMSDNDSEIADLTEGMYYGGGGDCLHVSERSSRIASPIDEQSKQPGQNFDGKELEYEMNMKALQHELQNKIIEVQELKLHYEKALEEQKNMYEREVYDCKTREIREVLSDVVSQHCQTEWDMEKGELARLRAAYDHQLEEQVARAKSDIVNALQEQIQALLNAESDVEENWPAELLELRDKLTNNARIEIQLLKETHDQLRMTILELQRKLMNAESKKETITEGYGENYDTGPEVTLQDFSQLQERARHVLSNGGGDCGDLLQLIEELCRQSDKLMEEGKREKEDLQKQVPLEPTPTPYIHRVRWRKIEAADKQLKATRRFLDEQASERETERDEAAKQIQHLQDQLKEREREKERDQRITSEQPTLSPEESDVTGFRASEIKAAVEILESQMKEMSSLMSDTEAKKTETESELKAAVDKIWVLREIITDLEYQLQAKTEKEESLKMQISQLETVIAAQTKNQHELVQELDAIKMGSETKQLSEHINHLQEELRRHKLSTEQFNVNSAALKQMKSELRDMQNQLDKRIKDMESTHMCSSNLSLSHPSEDISIRDQIEATRCPTPDDPTAPPMLPLDQLLKFKEKMMKHARVEEVALKRIKDLELQVTALKNQNEELQAEQEILQQTASEQLFQIEAMRGRLEQHKQSAPFAQRQATSRLEIQLHEANTKFQSLERAIAEKELELKDSRDQLDRVNQLLQEKEAEIANVVQMEGTTIQKLKQHVEVLEEDKKILLTKLGIQEHAQLELPRLIDSMLADKNEEIDHLKEQLSKKEKQLDLYSSLNLDESQLRELARQTEAKNSARTLSDILSIHSECEETVEAIRGSNMAQNLPNMSDFKLPTLFASSKNMEESAMPLTDTSKMCLQVPLLDLGSQTISETNQQSAIQDALHSGLDFKTSSENNISVDKTDHAHSWQESEKSSEIQRVTSKKCTQTSVDEGLRDIEDLENRLQTIQEELAIKSAILNKREADLNALHKLYNELQAEFKEVVDTLSRDKCFYQNQYEVSRASENKIKKDLLEVENILKLRNEEIEDHRDKMQMNEKILMELKSENNRLKKDAEEKEQEQMRKYANLLQEKMKELQNFRDAILEKDITIETIQTRNIEIENENKQLYEFKTKYQSTVQELLECQNEIQRLTEGLNNRDQIIRRLEEMARRSSFSDTSSPSNEKDQEIHHLQEYLKEKDKVIRQMSDDSKSLHKALETIQNKMKESGNVVELRKKLKDERKLNTELRSMVDTLSKEVSDLKLTTQRSQDDTDIEDMVQRELNLSADLDRQILNAIESDADEKIEKQSPYQEQELRMKLSQANKINEELKKIKDDLEIERGMLKCQIAEYEGRIFQLKSDLTEESKKLAKLDEELSSEKNLVRTLKIQIEREHRAMHSGHVQDSELIEFLQSKLKTSLDNETKLRSDLSLLRQEHKGMQIQLSLMKEQVAQSQKYDELPKLTDLLEAERNRHLSLMESFEKIERENTELKDTLKKLLTEKNRLEKQLEIEMEEKEKLSSSLTLSEELKDHMQTDLRRTKEELKLREDECEWLQKRIKTMSDAESKRQEQRTSEHNELKALRREINNARDVMMDLEADMKQSKRELTESIEREMKLTETLEAIKEKESELQKKLSSAKEVEKKLKDTIAELQQDLKASTKKEQELWKQMRGGHSDEKNVPPKFLQKIEDLSESNERYITEKSVLQEKLINVMSEKEQLSQRIKLLESQIKRNKVSRDLNIPPDYVEKLQHFYGKFLRADSRRKALTYQKRYLLTIIGGYQISEENTMCVLAQLTKVERAYAVIERNKKSPRVRFRSVVHLLVSIQRMKWLIVRWNTGKRVGAKTLLWNADHSFLPVPEPANVNHSPPVREKCSHNEDGGLDGFVLQQYYQRLKNIQQTLGLAMSEAGNRQIIPE
ncbi:golgin subfamily A member 4-like isoform X3 [Ceratina calcarata]|uniref:Golgin subfamily A member 4-like isoform X3 n=1 Tax=Ceratina calcarata TaxID=156304 RepID=A0AAJ7W9A9_9HYME|nr:golgin subfamily A member 4-like isoform X3 [Ceratina calcarata]